MINISLCYCVLISHVVKAQFNSVQFSLLTQNKYYNTRMHKRIVSWQGSPEKNHKAYEAWAPQSQRKKLSENWQTVMH